MLLYLCMLELHIIISYVSTKTIPTIVVLVIVTTIFIYFIYFLFFVFVSFISVFYFVLYFQLEFHLYIYINIKCCVTHSLQTLETRFQEDTWFYLVCLFFFLYEKKKTMEFFFIKIFSLNLSIIYIHMITDKTSLNARTSSTVWKSQANLRSMSTLKTEGT